MEVPNIERLSGGSEKIHGLLVHNSVGESVFSLASTSDNFQAAPQGVKFSISHASFSLRIVYLPADCRQERRSDFFRALHIPANLKKLEGTNLWALNHRQRSRKVYITVRL